MSARTRVLLLSATALLATPTGAAADVAFAPCEPAPIQCATVTVPVDRSGAVPGTIDLAVYRAPATGPSRGVLLGLPGGPGDGARGYFVRRLAAFDAARRTHDLVFLDPRGAGRSGALRCDDAAGCTAELGPAAHLYTSREVADDVESVRAALGVDRVALYGISYGAWYAQTYARRYPDRVSALALDSPVTRAYLDDAFDRDSFAAIPAALRALCPCPRDPYRDAAAVVRRLTGENLIEAAQAATTLDLNPAVRSALGASVAAHRGGDTEPLKRIVEAALIEGDEDRERFNPGTNLVVQCEERGLPWERTAPADQRLPEAQRRLAAIPPSAFAPFAPGFALLGGIIPGCVGWAAAPDSPLVGGDLPPVPTLVLAGEADIRTPAAGARALAGSVPGARYLEVGDVGHSVLSEDPNGCGSRAVAALIDGTALPASCPAADLRPRPPYARHLADVPGRGRTRKLVAAAVLTATDALNHIAAGLDARKGDSLTISFRGLRGGGMRGSRRIVSLTRAQWIRGLEVSGVARAGGVHDLRITGVARGMVRLRGRRFVARLRGRSIRGTLDLGAVGASGTPVGDML